MNEKTLISVLIAATAVLTAVIIAAILLFWLRSRKDKNAKDKATGPKGKGHKGFWGKKASGSGSDIVPNNYFVQYTRGADNRLRKMSPVLNFDLTRIKRGFYFTDDQSKKGDPRYIVVNPDGNRKIMHDIYLFSLKKEEGCPPVFCVETRNGTKHNETYLLDDKKTIISPIGEYVKTENGGMTIKDTGSLELSDGMLFDLNGITLKFCSN